jgi:hypothetical protein
MSRSTVKRFAPLALMLGLASISYVKVLNAQGCWVEPPAVKPVPPPGCGDLVMKCACDLNGGNCRYQWVCVRQQGPVMGSESTRNTQPTPDPMPGIIATGIKPPVYNPASDAAVLEAIRRRRAENATPEHQAAVAEYRRQQAEQKAQKKAAKEALAQKKRDEREAKKAAKT